MRELKAALQEHPGDVTQAQFVARTPEHDEQDDVGWEFQIIEGRVGSFIELSSARGAAKDAIAELGTLG